VGAWKILAVVIAGLSVAGCTSDPNAPINQTFPIRQMDQFFGSLSAPRAASAAPDYTHEPGYAPAYPQY
jgi:outer membrane murein-binding lipoprotein Lpp